MTQTQASLLFFSTTMFYNHKHNLNTNIFYFISNKCTPYFKEKNIKITKTVCGYI